MLRERAVQEQEQRSKRRKLLQKAEKRLAEAIQNASDDFEAKEIRWDDIPFQVHETHNPLVYIGGYVGCKTCGLYASVVRSNNGLTKPCRKECPTGTRGPVSRMQNGKHPRGKAGQEWPDGSSTPTPRVVQAPMPNTT